MGRTIPVERGCGFREAGAIYIECGLSGSGMPISYFLQDPPIPIDLASMGMSDQGVHPFMRKDREGNEVWHAINVVGQKNYPNVADYIEEVRRFGLSTRVQRLFPFHLLSEKSRILSVHRRAVIEEPAIYYETIAAETVFALEHDRPEIAATFSCPKRLVQHTPVPENELLHQTCAGLWWEDVTNAELEGDPTTPPRTVERRLPSFNYYARKRPLDAKPTYQYGIFMSLPIENLAVIDDPFGGRHQIAVEAVAKSSLPWSIDPA